MPAAAETRTAEPTDYLSRLSQQSSSGNSQQSSQPSEFRSGSRSTSRNAHSEVGLGQSHARRSVHTITWKVERWSALPSGFRQGARYRPPGGSNWSLDLYKGGIKRDKPGMVALYVHYNAPDVHTSSRRPFLSVSLLKKRSFFQILTIGMYV